MTLVTLTGKGIAFPCVIIPAQSSIGLLSNVGFIAVSIAMSFQVHN